jgi:hypothetical protein
MSSSHVLLKQLMDLQLRNTCHNMKYHGHSDCKNDGTGDVFSVHHFLFVNSKIKSKENLSRYKSALSHWY